jgi:hypothetical protein
MVQRIHQPTRNDNLFKLSAQLNSPDTVLEETRVNAKLESLRMVQLTARGVKVILNEQEYALQLKKVIFGGACSLNMIEQILSHTKAASSVKFGRHALNLCPDDNPRIQMTVKRVKSNQMKSFELSFDKRQYNEYNKEQKEELRRKIVTLLKVASQGYSSLEEFNVEIPDEVDGELEQVLRDKPDFRLKGVKKINYGQRTVRFQNLYNSDI